MNGFYVISYVCLSVLMYACEFFVFGLWYRLNIKSNVDFFVFCKKMLEYYCYQLHSLFKYIPESEPEPMSSMRVIFAVFIPIVFPVFILIADHGLLRCMFFFCGIVIAVGPLFLKEKVLTEVQIKRWIRFLYSPECRPIFPGAQREIRRGRVQKDEDRFFRIKDRRENSDREEEIPLSKEEIRKDRLLLIPVGVVGIAWGIILAVGTVSDIRSGVFGKWKSPFEYFSSGSYNTAFCISSALLILTVFIYLCSDKKFRNQEKERVVGYIDGEKRKIKNVLGLGKGIYMDPVFAGWETAVDRMCKVLNIRLVAVVSEDYLADGGSGRIAMTVLDQNKVPTIVLSARMIEYLRTRYSPQMVYDMVRFLLGHELTHVRYRDFSSRMNALRGLILIIAAFGIIYGGVIIAAYVSEVVTPLGFLLEIALLLFGILLCLKVFNDSYWKCVSEYRADRRSAEISGASDKAIEAVLNLGIANGGEVKTTRFGRKIKTHPDAKHRIYELRRGKKWGISEYFRYAICMEWRTGTNRNIHRRPRV